MAIPKRRGFVISSQPQVGGTRSGERALLQAYYQIPHSRLTVYQSVTSIRASINAVARQVCAKCRSCIANVAEV
jgi:hypothetical protein